MKTAEETITRKHEDDGEREIKTVDERQKSSERKEKKIPVREVKSRANESVCR